MIEHYKDLLANPAKIYALIKEETQELVEKFGDERRTDIVPDEVEQLDIEDLIQNEEMVILISNLGFIKRIPSSAYKIQNRGGKGSSTAKLVEDDFIDQVFTAVTHDYIMFISNLGKAYYLKVHEIPEATRTTKGTHIKALLAIDAEEEITAIVSFKEFSPDIFLIMATSSGTIKKIPIDTFANAKTRGIRALNLKDSDHLVSAILSTGYDNIMLVTKQGKALRISGNTVRPQGRTAGGVKGINISYSDELAGAVRVVEKQSILLITANGFGKRIDFAEFAEHGRGTGGQKIYTVTERTGEVIGVITVFDDDEVVCITGQGKTLRLKVDSVGIMGRAAQGVRVLNIDAPDFLVGLDVVAREDSE